MKNLIFIMLSLPFLIFGLGACNKDNKAAKELDGHWRETLTERVINGNPQGIISPLYEGGDWYLYRCKVSSEIWCDALIQYYSQVDTAWINYPYFFQIKDKADSLLIREGESDTSRVLRFKLAELEDGMFTLEQTTGDTLLRRVFTRVE
jgi:hypothetical protein